MIIIWTFPACQYYSVFRENDAPSRMLAASHNSDSVLWRVKQMSGRTNEQSSMTVFQAASLGQPTHRCFPLVKTAHSCCPQTRLLQEACLTCLQPVSCSHSSTSPVWRPTDPRTTRTPINWNQIDFFFIPSLLLSFHLPVFISVLFFVMKGSF
jgi:hypothetical protein